MTRLLIGTSGWHYKHWLGNFYPAGLSPARMLAHYMQVFDTVELNNTFYHLPDLDSLARWRDATPPDFCFAVKGSRFLTHMKKLKDAAPGLQRFLDAVDTLEPKLGPILFQLPPQWEVNTERLREFLALLPPHRRCVFEFRNPTWEIPEVYAALADHNAGYCVFDLAGYQSPLRITSDFAYVRLHGPGGKYQGTYSEEALQSWADTIRKWSGALSAVYVYFDNDQDGHAPVDALRLLRLLGRNEKSGS